MVHFKSIIDYRSKVEYFDRKTVRFSFVYYSAQFYYDSSMTPCDWCNNKKVKILILKDIKIQLLPTCHLNVTYYKNDRHLKCNKKVLLSEINILNKKVYLLL